MISVRELVESLPKLIVVFLILQRHEGSQIEGLYRTSAFKLIRRVQIAQPFTLCAELSQPDFELIEFSVARTDVFANFCNLVIDAPVGLGHRGSAGIGLPALRPARTVVSSKEFHLALSEEAFRR